MVDGLGSRLPRRSLYSYMIAGASAAAATALAQQTTPAPKEGRNLAAQLEAAVPEILRTTEVPGLAISLVSNRQVTWTKGFGVRSTESNQPVDSDTVFEAASLSKPAFAYVALQFVENGQLELDAPLSGYVTTPWIANEPRLKLITTRMVLSHTSGLPHGRPPGSPVALRFDPGARFAYSANGIEYLRAVVERLSGQPLPALMNERLFQPLKMTRSSFGWQEGFRGNYAEGHSRRGRIALSGNGEFLEANDEEKARIARDYPEFRYPSASAGLYTTPGDYARFLSAIMGSSTKQALSPPPLTSRLTGEMLKVQTRINNSIAWGLGFGLESSAAGDAFWHWGDWGVYRNFAIGYQATGNGVVVLTNSYHGPSAYQKIISRVLGGEHPAFDWVDKYRP